MINLSVKPKEILLLGHCDYTDDYITYLNEADIRIRIIVDNSATSGNLYGNKAISREEYIKNISNYRKLPLVVLDGTDGKNGSFLKTASDIINLPGFEDTVILHPAFLVDYLKVEYNWKTFINCCNRSGSTLLFHIQKTLLEKKHIEAPKKEGLFERLSKNHFEILIGFLNVVFTLPNAYYTTTGACSFANVDFLGAKNASFFFMNPLRSNRYVFDTVHRTYSNLDISVLRKVGGMGYKIFTPIRHPLDLIVSNAFEIEIVIIPMNLDKDLDRSESDFRERYGITQLDDINWFESMALYIREYLEQVLEHSSMTNLVKYEDMISQPVETIKQISEILEIEITDGEAASIWKKFAFKPLSTFKTHMFRPGAGKWMQYFNHKHIDLLKSLGYEKLCRELGYDMDLILDNKRGKTFQYNEELNSLIAVRDGIFNLSFGKPVVFKSNNMTFVEALKNNQKIKFVTNDQEFLRTFNNLISSNVFTKLLSSLDPHKN